MRIPLTETKKKLVIASKSRPCHDCGVQFHLAAMEFDHLPEFEKCFQLSRWIEHSIDEIVTEIRKCEVVCANCHRVRTSNRSEDKSGVSLELEEEEEYTPVVHGPARRIGRPAEKLRIALRWLESKLQDGYPVHSQQLFLSAEKEAGIAPDTLRKAREKIAESKIIKRGKTWYWVKEKT